jgi:hypothetical protein
MAKLSVKTSRREVGSPQIDQRLTDGCVTLIPRIVDPQGV